MKSIFYLASHDYISSPEPRKCLLLRVVKDQKGDCLYVVEIDPPLPKRIFDRDINCVLLQVAGGGSLDGIDKEVIYVDIYYMEMEKIVDSFSRTQLEKIGGGTLHSTLEEANKHSPLED